MQMLFLADFFKKVIIKYQSLHIKILLLVLRAG